MGLLPAPWRKGHRSPHHCWHLMHLCKPQLHAFKFKPTPKTKILVWLLCFLSKHGIFSEGVSCSVLFIFTTPSNKLLIKKKSKSISFCKYKVSTSNFPLFFLCGRHIFHTDVFGTLCVSLQQALRQASKLSYLTSPVGLGHWLGPLVQVGPGWRLRRERNRARSFWDSQDSVFLDIWVARSRISCQIVYSCEAHLVTKTQLRLKDSRNIDVDSPG